MSNQWIFHSSQFLETSQDDQNKQYAPELSALAKVVNV